jgi:hypothetical protein
MTDQAEHMDSAPAALARALDSYARWLDYHMGFKGDGADMDASGAVLLRGVIEIRRHQCPGANQLMTDLMLGHTRLTAILFEQQRKRVRGEPTEPLIINVEFISLVERQRATVLGMRSACVNARGMCIHTVSSVKITPRPFVARPSALGEPKPLQGLLASSFVMPDSIRHP